jgi:hypothetical protein
MPKKRRWYASLVTVAGAVALATVTGIAPWSAEHIAHLVGPTTHRATLVSYSVSELDQDPCEWGRAFVPDPAAHGVLREGPPAEWSDLFEHPGAAFVGGSAVQVSIQGESRRTVTLTGINFKAKDLGKRPNGVAFDGQCGGGALGRFLIAELNPPGAKLVQASWSFRDRQNQARVRPIKFPWTVSLTDPLLLYVGATTNRCFCEWSAEIPWVSGSRHGVIAIGKPGHGFRVINDAGLPAYFPIGNEWDAPTG